MERRAITIEGIVQGAGFRPFVHNLAARLHLAGYVKNRAGSVVIEIEDEAPSLDRFQSELTAEPPPLARIDHINWVRTSAQGDARFSIEASDGDAGGALFCLAGHCDLRRLSTGIV